MAGCGNSRLSEDLYEDGYSSIANIDISRVVVDQMTDKYKEKPALTWQQMNVCSLEFPDESYDAVIGKATMDAVLCGEGSTANIAKMCSEGECGLRCSFHAVCSCGDHVVFVCCVSRREAMTQGASHYGVTTNTSMPYTAHCSLPSLECQWGILHRLLRSSRQSPQLP